MLFVFEITKTNKILITQKDHTFILPTSPNLTI